MVQKVVVIIMKLCNIRGDDAWFPYYYFFDILMIFFLRPLTTRVDNKLFCYMHDIFCITRSLGSLGVVFYSCVWLKGQKSPTWGVKRSELCWFGKLLPFPKPLRESMFVAKETQVYV